MAGIFNAKTYKLGKIYSNDLTSIITRVELALREFQPYSRYKSVQKILLTLNKELEILKNHKIECDAIVKNKGQVRE